MRFDRLVIATDAFWKGWAWVAKGERHDVDDPIVKRAPEMFAFADGSPITNPAA